MSKNNDLGKDAEELAVIYLKRKNYRILEVNYRVGYKEIDIICQDGRMIIFVEVKYRSEIHFGYPEDFVNEKKRQNIKEAAFQYIESLDRLTPVRFDIVSIAKDGNISDILHFEDAFY